MEQEHRAAGEPACDNASAALRRPTHSAVMKRSSYYYYSYYHRLQHPFINLETKGTKAEGKSESLAGKGGDLLALGFPVSLDCLDEPTKAASCAGLPRGNPTLQCSDHLGPGPRWRNWGSLASQVGFSVSPHPAFFPSLNKLWLNCWPPSSKQEDTLH